jgi:two-component system, response regulator PdtaR
MPFIGTVLPGFLPSGEPMPASPYYEEEADNPSAVAEGELAVAAGKRILIVEDEPPVAQYIAELLSRYGCVVCGTAASGRRAVELALATKPDLALIDIGLKGAMDGILAATELKSQLRLDTIFLSGSIDPVARERANAAAPIDFIQKPFLPEDLEQVLRKAFGRP